MLRREMGLPPEQAVHQIERLCENIAVHDLYANPADRETIFRAVQVLFRRSFLFPDQWESFVRNAAQKSSYRINDKNIADLAPLSEIHGEERCGITLHEDREGYVYIRKTLPSSAYAGVPGVVWHGFLNEVMVQMDLGITGMVPIDDFQITPDGNPILSMRYYDGGNVWDLKNFLMERLSVCRSVDAGDEVLARYAERIAKPVASLSAAGIVHRDVKPCNLFISDRGDIHLGDSSTAVSLSCERHLKGDDLTLGTLGYMPIEYMEKKGALDLGIDAYALGATILYLCHPGISSESPYKDRLQVLMEFLHGKFRVPPKMDAIVRKALAPDRKDRYRDSRALLQDIRKVLKSPSQSESGPEEFNLMACTA